LIAALGPRLQDARAEQQDKLPVGHSADDDK
jgi:hypothetical protein